MKIHSLTGTFGYSTRVKEKQDGQSPGHSSQQHNQDASQQEENKKNSSVEVTEEEISKAVEAFKTDQEAQANGLRASVSGEGPGLRIVLRDGTGSVIRQLTGEEFLRLRDTSTIEGRIRGKLLDQKL